MTCLTSVSGHQNVVRALEDHRHLKGDITDTSRMQSRRKARAWVLSDTAVLISRQLLETPVSGDPGRPLDFFLFHEIMNVCVVKVTIKGA